ncbi:hypothetical protein [Streptomyces puniciscabiei]|uniref:hypothetical protein n=1 Tax=Streptomyces puniciscabiei TaxID=164348 RepID=UPI00331D2E84
MQVITVADDGTVRIELTANEAKAMRDDLANSRSHSPQSREFARYVDHLFGEQSAPTFPGGGF